MKESLRIESEQLELIKKQAKEENDKLAEENEKVELNVRKAKRDLELAQDESKLRGVVKDMVNDAATGDTSLNGVIRTLSEFLCKFLSSLCTTTILFLCFFLLAPLNQIKRMSKKDSDLLETIFFDLKTVKADTAFLKNDYLEFKQEMRLAVSNLNAKGSYVSEFFPANNNEMIDRFLKKDDGYSKRIDSLYLLMSECDAKTKRLFSDSFLRTLFTKDYMNTYLWPLGRYEIHF